MRGIILAGAIALLPVPAQALTVLCVEEGSTGFNWRNGDWVQTNYHLDQFIMKDVSEDPELGTFCSPEPPVEDEYGVIKGKRCFNQADVGEEPGVFGTSHCRVYYKPDMTTVRTVYCEGGYAEINFEAPGEFVLTRTYSAPDGAMTKSDQRDSLVISVGKCSVIAP